MTTFPTAPRRHHAGTLVLRALGGGLAVGLFLQAAPASADQAPPPTLRISVDNGRTSAEVGDELDYTISVENLGEEAVRDLRISQTMPPGLSFISADRKGMAVQEDVVWQVHLDPTSTVELHSSMTVGATPAEVLRLATVACAALAADKPAIVCATHSDELPAGARATAAADDPATAASSDPVSRTSLAVVAGAGLLVVMGGWFVLLARRRRALPAVEESRHLG